MKKGDYTVVADRLQKLLDNAGKPGADYDDLRRQVNIVDYGMKFPMYSPVSDAKDAVISCLGPMKYKKNWGHAASKISSCSISDNIYL